MAQSAVRTATYADLEAVPPHLVAEIINGRLVTHPRPAPRHGLATGALQSTLSIPFQFGRGGLGGWVFIAEPELHLNGNVVVPDIAGWRRQRMPDLPETAWIDIAPDWLCEVLSPSTERYDRGEKRAIYAEAGVPHVWHVDPRLQMLEVFELKQGKWVLTGVFHDDAEVTAPPFADLTFNLGLLWPFDQPTPSQA